MVRSNNQICKNCPYYNQKHLEGTKYKLKSKNPKLEMENNNSDTLLILQSPGENEWKNCKPLYYDENVNKNTAGARINKACEANGNKREDYSITNIVQCFQGKKLNSNDDDKLDKNAKECCLGNLINDLRTHKWEKIIVFGSEAKKQVKRAIRREKMKFEKIYYSNHPTAKRGKPTDEDLKRLLRKGEPNE